MKTGDLVKMKEEPFPHNPYGLGVIIKDEDDYGNPGYYWVFFKDIVDVGFNGFKWMNEHQLEVVSEFRRIKNS
mgnify:FL=1